MADTRNKGDGLKFSTEVIETIAGIAASEIDGIVSMSGGVVEDFVERFGRKNLSKGVSVDIEEQELRIDLKVIVEYGTNVPDLYQKASLAVEKAIENMTGLHVVEVNMYVEGVVVRDELDQLVRVTD
ncbi:Asp23/Gls24 family envelope stress response protein [Lihuaxuella thermophila]|uniref:Alkaline shock protein 23 n=1 Tax=Lihuaxuella thermophila TaxID=1173111 RepID=A0A1H8J6M0_9BACL|nr:Asp23/Gls24 family envelope stress response protein [Lihuaxuella thermophila]SEN76115.1 Uncharacterized conserved protein YloU, alkaline shock protein (Asp23) family [Lihuaxuella thermophila]